LKQPIRLCPVIHSAEEEGEVELCQHEYETIRGNGFIDFLYQNEAIRETIQGETGGWLIISPTRSVQALTRWTDHVARQPYADCYDYLWHLAARGYNARVGAGLEFLVLRKPEKIKENLNTEFCPTSEGDLTNKIPFW